MIRRPSRIELNGISFPPESAFSGQWRDEHGSQMNLSCEGRTVHGSYHATFKVGGPWEAFPLSGFFKQDLISFTVDFGAHHSLAAWVGQLALDESQEPLIRTAWLLGQHLKLADETQSRGTALSGINEFHRIGD